MRSVSSPTAAALAAADGAPAYLVLVSFDGATARFCTRETVTWNGSLWISAGVTVDPPSGSKSAGRLTFSDPDYAVHSLIFSAPFKNRAVDIWQFYGASLADADPVYVASCVTTGAESAQGRRVIGLQRLKTSLLQSPRRIIGPAIGCNFLPTPGQQIPWGGKILTLDVPNG